LPTIQVTGGEELLHCIADPGAEQGTFADRPVQLAQNGEGGEVGGQEDGESPDGAGEVAAQRGRRATLEGEPVVVDRARGVTGCALPVRSARAKDERRTTRKR